MASDVRDYLDRFNMKRVVFYAFLVLAAFLLYLPSETCCALAIPPDSSEYAIGLVNLLEHGKFGFTLNGVWYPSRYAPWFPLTCLTPAYLLSGGNPLCLHWAILAFALSLLVLMVKWGKRIGLGKWSVVSAILLLLLPDFAFYSRVVMTEIPYVAIFAASALLWLRLLEQGRGVSLKFCLGTGMLVAWGGMVRPTILPMLVPFALLIWRRFTWRTRFSRLAVLVTPAAVYELANLLYNWSTFGSCTRSGYQYWVPIPCDYPHLLFNWGNLCRNAADLLGEPVVQITLVMMLVSLVLALLILRGRFGGVERNVAFLGLLGYLGFQALVLLVLYSSYFWSDSRFYISITICAIPLFLYSCLLPISRLSFRLAPVFLIFVALLSGMSFLKAHPLYQGQPSRRQKWLAKGQIAGQVLPENSVVIQYGDPNVLGYFGLSQRNLTLFPYERVFDYVKHMIAPVPIRDHYRPISAKQQRAPELIERGVCKAPFPETFVENPERLKFFLSSGKRIFLEQEVIGGEDNWDGFQKKLRRMGLTTRCFGGWTAPALTPNTMRHLYDSVVLGDCDMDSRPETAAIFHEIVRLEEAGQ